MSSGLEDALYTPQLERQPVRPVHLLQRRVVEPELQLAGQRLEWQQPGGGRKSPTFSPYLSGEFCLS